MVGDLDWEIRELIPPYLSDAELAATAKRFITVKPGTRLHVLLTFGSGTPKKSVC